MLSPIFLPKDASQREISMIHCINAQVTMVNNGNGNATPGWHLHMYYQQGGRFCVKERNYRDRIHWSLGRERIAQNKLRLWKEIRERQEGREDRREGRREREGLRKRQAEVERRIAEYRRSQREECERRIEGYAREQRETLREEEERRPGRLIIRYAREQRKVIREDEEQDGDLRDRLRRRR